MNILYKKKLLLLCFFLIFTPILFAEQAVKEISICIDENDWLPFTFLHSNEPSGIHVELAEKALTNLGYTVSFSSAPWKRCLHGVELGVYDAILSVSYKPDRAEYMYYPADAELLVESRQRVTSAEYVIVEYITSRFEWNGDDETLPEPVRIAYGSGTADRLREKGILVETARSDSNIFGMLKRDKTGIALSFRASAEALLRKKTFNGFLKILPNPYASKPYYMGISKSGKISFEEAQRIWNEIAINRENEVFMDSIVDKIEHQIKDGE